MPHYGATLEAVKCHYSRPVGNLIESNFSDVWNGQTMQSRGAESDRLLSVIVRVYGRHNFEPEKRVAQQKYEKHQSTLLKQE